MSFNSAAYAALIGFFVNIAVTPFLIPFLKRLKFGQNVRSDGPESHLKKAGTPTMGGIIILLSFVIASLFFLKENKDGLMLVFVTVGFGLIGFLDDYIKVVKKRSLGLRAYQKFALQMLITGVFCVYLIRENNSIFGVSATSVLIPFTNGYFADLGVYYIPFVFFVMLGTVNGANFTDGLDGLASGVTVLIATFFVFIALVAESMAMPILSALIGSLMGFLLFNSHPAKIFMGDTGSLSLGGLIAASAILLKMPIFLVIVAIIYMIEVLSVMIQVSYYKLTKRRFFKMAPIHHSFELSGWGETKIVTLFYVVTAIACLIGYLGAQGIF